MVALGLVLLVLSGAVGLGVVLSNTDPVSASAFGVTLSNVTVGGFFLVGAATGLVFALGLGMLMAGSSRRRTKRRATKQLVRDTRTEKEKLAQENADLRAKLDSEPYPAEVTTATDTRADTRADRQATAPAEAEHRTGVFRR